MTKQFDGIANKGNNADWSARSKAHSYHADKGQLRHDLGGEGALKDFNAGDVKDWRQPQKDHEGRGWAPINRAAKPNTFTGE